MFTAILSFNGDDERNIRFITGSAYEGVKEALIAWVDENYSAEYPHAMVFKNDVYGPADKYPWNEGDLFPWGQIFEVVENEVKVIPF